jgi:hypothetical protein
MLPDRAIAIEQGWTHQVTWLENGKSCLMRFKCATDAAEWAGKLEKQGVTPVIIYLIDASKLE